MTKTDRAATSGRFFGASSGDTLQCELCPQRCRIAPGSAGFCGVRANRAGKLHLPFFGAVSALAVDPIEKKPLYHYFPGCEILSVGFLGCSLRCPYCQNYRIAHDTTARTQYIPPQQLVQTARNSGSFAIAYTYNEPTIHIEYLLECGAAAHRAGLKNVLVTAGSLNDAPACELLDLMDAVNIDLKSFSAEYYRKTLHAELESVLGFTRTAVERCHVEITTLLVPGATDSDDEIHRIAEFVARLNPAIPLHLSAYHPTSSFRTASTPAATVHARAETARRFLRYVYPGNLGEQTETRCPACGELLIQRNGYRTVLPGIASGGTCKACGRETDIVRH